MENEKRIKVLASDIGGVIALFKHNAKPGTLKDFADWLAYFTKIPSDEWLKSLNYSPGTEEYDFILGKITPKEFYWRLRNIANIWYKTAYHKPRAPFPSPQLFRKAWCNIFAINIELLERLRALSKTYKIVLASNLDVWHYEFLWDLCEFDQFVNRDGSVFSCYDNVLKPDPAFWRLLTKKNNVAPPDIFVLDDRADNCESARACGIDVCQFVDNKSFFKELERRTVSFLDKE
jgi:FMN phosphatase YigB (HAD superfamily)